MPEKIPPHSKEAEQSTLGAAMLDPEALSDVINVVKPQDFYVAAHREIFAAIYELFRRSEPVDIVTVCEELSKRGSLEIAGGSAYVSSLPSNAPTVVNASGYARIVAEKASLRSLIKTADEIKEKGYDENEDASVILDYAEQKIFDISQEKQSKDYSHIKDILLENTQMIDKASRSQGHIGINTGFADLDKKTAGLQKSDLIIVAARPSMGKSSFALTMALNAAKKEGITVLIFSLEMSKAQMGQRLLSMEANIEMERLKRGQIDNRDWKDINLALDKMSKTNIIIDDTAGISMLEMKNKCRRVKSSHDLGLVVVDYLQLMSAEGRTENRQQEISKLSRSLKLLAREMDCPVVVLSQLSRAPEQRNDKRPILSDLRESGAIEQDADMVMFLYRDDYYNEDSETPNVCEVNLAKNRNGETGRVNLTWVARYTKFSDRMGEKE